MLQVHDGECGLCYHFGEKHAGSPQLTQIHTSHEAPETLTDDCGHPRNAQLHLKVTPISRCDAFEPVRASAGR